MKTLQKVPLENVSIEDENPRLRITDVGRSASLNAFYFPKDVKFSQKTEVVSVSFHPITDKEFKKLKVAKTLTMVLTLEISVWLNDFVLPKYKKILKQKIDEETFINLIKYLKK